jgi:peptide chain release factor
MSVKNGEVWLQISAGQGPIECAWAVLKVLQEMRKEAEAAGLDIRAIGTEPGPEPNTAYSVLLTIPSGPARDSFVDSWRGTVQWVARSPFRPEHKRKNWFVGIDMLEPVEEMRFNAKEVQWEVMCASGPGGQHVNRTESAVRVTHLPTGIQAIASEERSQHQNRKLALARLAKKIADQGTEEQNQANMRRWRAHQELSRGNPIRTFREAHC